LLCVVAGARPEFDRTTLVGDPSPRVLFRVRLVADWGVVTVFAVPRVFFSGEYTAGLNCVFDPRTSDFGVGGNSLLILAKTGDWTGALTFVFNGLGLCGDRTGGCSFRSSVWTFRGDAARGGFELNVDNGTEVEGFGVFTLNVVEGRRVAPYVVGGSGIVEASSIDGVGACDNLSPI
jgi:hypothetical protein